MFLFVCEHLIMQQRQAGLCVTLLPHAFPQDLFMRWLSVHQRQDLIVCPCAVLARVALTCWAFTSGTICHSLDPWVRINKSCIHDVCTGNRARPGICIHCHRFQPESKLIYAHQYVAIAFEDPSLQSVEDACARQTRSFSSSQPR